MGGMVDKLTLVAFFAAVGAACSSPDERPGAVDVGEGLRKSLSRDASKMSVTGRLDGTNSVHFNGGYQHAHMVRLNADGSLNYNCVTDAGEAERFLAGGGQ